MELTPLTEMFSSIPESIWGAIMGSALTLIGVRMTNRHNLKYQREQFKFEKDERQHDRRVTMRREVYLPAADAIVYMNVAIGRLLAPGNIDDEQSHAAKIFGSAITRVQMVAAPDTFKLMSELQRAYFSTSLALRKTRFPMQLRQSEIESVDKRMKTYQSDRDQVIEAMKQYNQSGISDARKWDRLQEQYQEADQEWDETYAEWSRLTRLQETQRIAMARELIACSDELSRLQAPALAAIRHELEATPAAELVMEEFIKTAVVAKQGLNEFLVLAEGQLATLGKTDEEMAQPALKGPKSP